MTDAQIKAIQRISEFLCGTCQSGDSLIQDESSLSGMDKLEITVAIEFYGEIFICDCCGWWCGNEEMHTSTGDSLCDQCYDEMDKSEDD